MFIQPKNYPRGSIVFGFYKKVFFGICCFFLGACSQIDDYLLGKDNTLKPKSLPAYQQKVTLKEIWTASIGKTDDAGYLKLKPAVAGETIYFADAKGRLSAFDKRTGKTIWAKQLSANLVSGPVVADHLLALGTNHASVLLLSAEDGRQLWEASVSGDVLASPLLTQKRVIAKTIDGRLFAFDKLSGKKLWSVNHGSPSLILRASSSPIKVDHSVIVGFSDGKLDAIELDTGRVIWQRSIAYASGSSDVERLVDIDADPLAEGYHLYLASYRGDVSAMSLKTGDLLWHKSAATYKNLASDSQALYLVDNQDVVMALDKKNGRILWKQTVLKARNVTAPVHLGHYLIVADKTGFVHVLDTRQGELVGRASLNAPIDAMPVVSDGYVYIVTQAGQLTCFALEG